MAGWRAPKSSTSGKLPFQGSSAELMYQHQYAALQSEKLKSVPAPIIALLEILLAKDPAQRFPGPAQLQKALPRVREAIDSRSRLTANDLRSIANQATEQSKGIQQKSERHLSVAGGVRLVPDRITARLVLFLR